MFYGLTMTFAAILSLSLCPISLIPRVQRSYLLEWPFPAFRLRVSPLFSAWKLYLLSFFEPKRRNSSTDLDTERLWPTEACFSLWEPISLWMKSSCPFLFNNGLQPKLFKDYKLAFNPLPLQSETSQYDAIPEPDRQKFSVPLHERQMALEWAGATRSSVPTFWCSRPTASSMSSNGRQLLLICREDWRRQLQQVLSLGNGRWSEGHSQDSSSNSWSTSTYNCVGSGDDGVCQDDLGYSSP